MDSQLTSAPGASQGSQPQVCALWQPLCAPRHAPPPYRRWLPKALRAGRAGIRVADARTAARLGCVPVARVREPPAILQRGRARCERERQRLASHAAPGNRCQHVHARLGFRGLHGLSALLAQKLGASPDTTSYENRGEARSASAPSPRTLQLTMAHRDEPLGEAVERFRCCRAALKLAGLRPGGTAPRAKNA